MATNPISVDLGPDERARLEAESRRRGIGTDAVIVELVRGLPGPDVEAQRGLEALARLEGMWREVPEISGEAVEAAVAADRTELETRAMRGSGD
ncbi:MAG: hypothetical protein U0Y82_09975 [Thermoleophilia bacterium]